MPPDSRLSANDTLIKYQWPPDSASLAERRVFEEAEAITLAAADVGRDRAVQGFVPLRVLVDEAVGRRLVALVLHAEHALQEVAHHVTVLVIVDAQLLRLAVEREQAVFEEEVPLQIGRAH